eukprot:2589254-Prymnesium_polylepis.1
MAAQGKAAAGALLAWRRCTARRASLSLAASPPSTSARCASGRSSIGARAPRPLRTRRVERCTGNAARLWQHRN